MKLLVNLAAPVLSPPRHEAQNAASSSPLPSSPLLPSQLLYILIKWESVRIIVFLFIPFSLLTVRVHTLQLFYFFCPFDAFFPSLSHLFSSFNFSFLVPPGTFFATFSLFPSFCLNLSPSHLLPHPSYFPSLPSPPPVLSFACALMG